jgi:hypothetical protein
MSRQHASGRLEILCIDLPVFPVAVMMADIVGSGGAVHDNPVEGAVPMPCASRDSPASTRIV